MGRLRVGLVSRQCLASFEETAGSLCRSVISYGIASVLHHLSMCVLPNHKPPNLHLRVCFVCLQHVCGAEDHCRGPARGPALTGEAILPVNPDQC